MLEAPDSRELEFLRKWLIRPTMGNCFLKDKESTVWDPINSPDLVSLFPRRLHKDMFTTLLNGALLDLYHRLWGHRDKVRGTESL